MHFVSAVFDFYKVTAWFHFKVWLIQQIRHFFPPERQLGLENFAGLKGATSDPTA